MNVMAFLFWIPMGLGLGAVYLVLLAHSVAAIVGGGRWQSAALPLLLRIALAALIFGMAARQGALPVLSALAGFIMARSFGLSRMRAG